MRSTVKVTVPPAAEPVSLADAKAHLRVDHDADDTRITALITAARRAAEMYLSRALITQTLRWTVTPMDVLRPRGPFRLQHPLTLPRSPAQSISSVVITDETGAATTLTAPAYVADLAQEPGRIAFDLSAVLTGGQTLRSANLQNVQVTFVAGYGADGASVPQTITQAILLTVAMLYENRGDDGGELPQAVQWLLDTDRVMYLGGS